MHLAVNRDPGVTWLIQVAPRRPLRGLLHSSQLLGKCSVGDPDPYRPVAEPIRHSFGRLDTTAGASQDPVRFV